MTYMDKLKGLTDSKQQLEKEWSAKYSNLELRFNDLNEKADLYYNQSIQFKQEVFDKENEIRGKLKLIHIKFLQISKIK